MLSIERLLHWAIAVLAMSTVSALVLQSADRPMVHGVALGRAQIQLVDATVRSGTEIVGASSPTLGGPFAITPAPPPADDGALDPVTGPLPTEDTTPPTAEAAPTPSAAPAAAAPEPSPTTTAPPAQAMSADTPDADPSDERDAGCEADLHRWTEQVRAEAGVGPLTVDPAVDHVAADWSRSMAERHELAHNPAHADQIWAARPEAEVIGENVGRGDADDVRAVFDQFMASPTHRANIVEARFRHSVAACIPSADGQVWITVDFWG